MVEPIQDSIQDSIQNPIQNANQDSIKDFVQNNIQAFIQSKTDDNILFVLKGFSITALTPGGGESMPLASILNNKIARLIPLSQQEKPIIPFDEFICLYDILVLQFKKIYILENPLYHNLYPLYTPLDESVENALLAHFDEDADDRSLIGDIDEYLNVYSRLVRVNGETACCYNISESRLLHDKIEIFTLPLPTSPLPVLDNGLTQVNPVNICHDGDYFDLVRRLHTTEEVFAVTWNHYVAGKEMIEARLRKAHACFANRLYKAPEPELSGTVYHDAEVKALMKRYWEHDQFRQLAIYDLAAVARKQKKVTYISQGQIVGDLIQQAEKCMRGEDYRDVFVTAPTGAGKSLMFQLPAVYLAEKHNLVTLIISPLIGLMNDQVRGFERIQYPYAKTINGDISPLVKQEILEAVKNGSCHILYLSPESLLARSDVEQLIGSRRIGMIVIDEAHIVTTWGKQFRPDYWFLGDHVQKIYRAQRKKETAPQGFVIATFTATAIYEGTEDMYHETLNSLHMNDPITYLGYVKRENIRIEVSVAEKKNKVEYELNKFDDLLDMINTALMRGQKTLIYFPTVALITRFYEYARNHQLEPYIARYHGQLHADERASNFHAFCEGEKLIMLATKAFGMGIDISDITIVAHFAPTGNVCDYMQEIGRAARDSAIQGRAIYRHMSNDFKHINRLHGLSTLKKYQLVNVIEKILELYQSNLRNRTQTKRQNEMLIDAESFSYIFESPLSNSDDSDLINKVKTALLLIQKDYENRMGYSPFTIKPIPLFKNGYFAISPQDQALLNEAYPAAVKSVYPPLHICDVDLNNIWERLSRNHREGRFGQSMSFPRFKYLLYTRSAELKLNEQFVLSPAMEIRTLFNPSHEALYATFMRTLKGLLNDSARTGSYIATDAIAAEITSEMQVNPYQAEGIVQVLLAAIDIFQREYSGRLSARIYKTREAPVSGKVSYHFNASVRDFFTWMDKGYAYIKHNCVDEKIYVVNEGLQNHGKEMLTVLGVLESAGVLRFRSLGGSQSQIYIYVNTTRSLQEVRDQPQHYRNFLLDLIEKRHEDSVKMLSYLFQNNFTSDEIWNHMENYFLGIMPEGLFDVTPEVSTRRKKSGSMFTDTPAPSPTH